MTAGRAFARFDSAFGRCLVAWNDVGLTGVRLPDDDDAAFDAMAGRLVVTGLAEAEPPPPVAEAIGAIRALLDGHDEPLDRIAIDLSGTGRFEAAVYAAARQVGPGRTCTYGELARATAALAPEAMAGDPAFAARAVGRALGRNPWPLVVPCHRIVGADGGLVGFSAPGGVRTKRRLLALEAGLRPRDGELF